MKIHSFFQKGIKLLLLVLFCLFIPRLMVMSHMNFFDGFITSIEDICLDEDYFFRKNKVFICREKLKIRANRGDREAMERLVEIAGVNGYMGERIYWLRKFAEGGESWCLRQLGDIYKYGRDVGKDVGQAAEYYIKAYKVTTNPDVKNSLSYELLEMGNYFANERSDLEMAVKCFQPLAEGGNAEAQRKIAALYEAGKGDLNEALKWYRALNDANSVVRVNKKINLQSLQLAAMNGDAQAQYNLGNCFYKGQGVMKDEKQAVHWYRSAAEQGHALAQVYLGACYWRGIGVEENIGKAIEWYQKAADQGYEAARRPLEQLKREQTNGNQGRKRKGRRDLGQPYEDKKEDGNKGLRNINHPVF